MTKFTPTVEQLVSALRRSMQSKDEVGAQRAVDELLTRAWESIDREEDAPEGRRIAELMKEAGHPAGFEISAVIFEQAGEIDKAIESVQAGLQLAPTVSRLWELLGNLHSDADRHDQAQEAFDKALGCEHRNEPSIRYNKALSAYRNQKFDPAAAELDKIDEKAIDDDELLMHVQALRVSTLNGLEKFKEAIVLAKKILEKYPEDTCPESCIPHLAEVHAQLGRAILERDNDPAKALASAKNAIRCDQGNPLALDLVRAIGNKKSPDSKLLNLSVKGIWMEPFEGETEAPEFMQAFTVIADNQEEAFEMVKEICPDDLRERISIDECELVKDAPDEPKGVCEVSAFMFFSGDEEEEEGTDPPAKG